MKKILTLVVSVLLGVFALSMVFAAPASAVACVDSMDLTYVEYDHYGGSPGECDCDGNCWDSYGFWYADPSYTGDDFVFGAPGSVDGWGNRWNNYGLWEDDVFYPYENTPENAEYDDVGWDYTPSDDNQCMDGACDTPAVFWDVDPDNEYYYSVLHVANVGAFDGYDDGSFDPYGSINRAEFLKALVEFNGVTPDSSYSYCFDDVGTGWYAPYACYAKEQGWVEGYDDGTFRPGDTVSKDEALKMLLEVRGADVSACVYGAAMDSVASDWHCPYFQFSNEYDIVDITYMGEYDSLGYYYPWESMIRGEVADMFFRYDMYYLGVQ